MTVVGLIGTRLQHPDSKQPVRETQAFFFLPVPNINPVGLDHNRALGATEVKTAPGNLVHARALGAPLAFGTPVSILLLGVKRVGRIRERQEVALGTRAYFLLFAQEGILAGLDHERQLGEGLSVKSPLFPTGLVHARVLSSITVQTLLSPQPTTLLHVRALGAVLASTPVPVPLILPRTYWHRSLRGTRRRARWD